MGLQQTRPIPRLLRYRHIYFRYKIKNHSIRKRVKSLPVHPSALGAPPGVLKCLVLGNCYRIYTLCFEPEDVTALLRMFYYRLLRRGYSPSNLLPLFNCAYHAATERENTPPSILQLPDDNDAELLRSRIFFHTQYHPTNPPSSTLQQLWTSHIVAPPQDPHLSTVTDHHGGNIG